MRIALLFLIFLCLTGCTKETSESSLLKTYVEVSNIDRNIIRDAVRPYTKSKFFFYSRELNVLYSTFDAGGIGKSSVVQMQDFKEMFPDGHKAFVCSLGETCELSLEDGCSAAIEISSAISEAEESDIFFFLRERGYPILGTNFERASDRTVATVYYFAECEYALSDLDYVLKTVL
jgi:hypothetical protein